MDFVVDPMEGQRIFANLLVLVVEYPLQTLGSRNSSKLTVGTRQNRENMGMDRGDGDLPQTDPDKDLMQAITVRPLVPNLGGVLFTLFEPFQHQGRGIFTPI